MKIFLSSTEGVLAAAARPRSCLRPLVAVVLLASVPGGTFEGAESSRSMLRGVPAINMWWCEELVLGLLAARAAEGESLVLLCWLHHQPGLSLLLPS